MHHPFLPSIYGIRGQKDRVVCIKLLQNCVLSRIKRDSVKIILISIPMNMTSVMKSSKPQWNFSKDLLKFEYPRSEQCLALFAIMYLPQKGRLSSDISVTCLFSAGISSSPQISSHFGQLMNVSFR
jgi:hypothetical protein